MVHVSDINIHTHAHTHTHTHTHTQAPTVFRVRVRRYFTVHNLCHLLSRYYPLPSPKPRASGKQPQHHHRQSQRRRHALSLAFQGEPLIGDRRLASYGIGPGARLSLRLEPLAGAEEEDAKEEEEEVSGKDQANDDDASSASTTTTTTTVATSSVGLPDPDARFTVRVRPAGVITASRIQQHEGKEKEEEVTLSVSPLDTVGAVMGRYYQHVAATGKAAAATAAVVAVPRDAAMLFAGARLDPMAVLYDYGIGDGATLDLLLGGENASLRLTLTPLSAGAGAGAAAEGRGPLSLCVLGTATVADLKARARALLLLPAGAEMRLLAGGTELPEEVEEGEEDDDEEQAEQQPQPEEEEEQEEEEEPVRPPRAKTLAELGVKDGASLTLLLPAAEKCE